MFKKFASVALAASMVLGGAAITASAAEAEDAVAADDSSVVAAADDSSAVGADESSSVGSGKTISADVKSFGWGDSVKNVYCHIYSYSGDGKTYTDWQTKAEKCSYDASTGIATYDLQTGIDRGATGLSTIDGSNKWVVMFSANTGAETYTLIFNSSCFRDTVVGTGEMMENNVDSEKSSIGIKYENSSLTAPKCITSTGKVQGTSFAEGTSNDTLLGDYIFTYATDGDKWNVDNAKKMISDLGGVDAKAVAAYVANKAETDVKSGAKTAEEAAAITSACADVLSKATGTSEEEIKKAEEEGKKAADEGKSANEAASAEEKADSNGGSSNGGSSNGGSSTKSGSVSSGQETTIFFVLGGLMIAAAGVMFLARKKRQF